MLRIFIGYDPRQPISYHVLSHSLILNSRVPLTICPVSDITLPITRQGLTPFTFARFLVPWLCNYEGHALFLDADMVCRTRISDLFHFAADNGIDNKSVMVVKNSRRFEWTSLIFFNCANCKILTPEYVESARGLHILEWADDDMIGELPAEWNHLVGYDPPSHRPQIIHYTQGVPGFPETHDCEHAEEWLSNKRSMERLMEWKTIMGDSVHAVELPTGKKLPRMLFGEEFLHEMTKK